MFTSIKKWFRKILQGQSSISANVKSAPEIFPTPSLSSRPEAWVEQARTYAGIQEWKKAKDCASEAIKLNSSLVEAYMIRALAYRVVGELDNSILDYSKIIDIDPQNGEAWMFRGACKLQKSSAMKDQNQVLSLLNDAHPDYKRAAELMPDDEQAGLALLELEICAGKYREAVGTTGIWWNRIKISQNKLICAWLGSIAFILAGKSNNKWVSFKEYLISETATLGPTDWSIAEINGIIENFASQNNYDETKLKEIQAIHKAFIQHFTGKGPTINK